MYVPLAIVLWTFTTNVFSSESIDGVFIGGWLSIEINENVVEEMRREGIQLCVLRTGACDNLSLIHI